MASSKPPSEELDRVYRRLVAGEPDAPSDLIELLLDPLMAALRRKFPVLSDSDLLIDTVTDTLFRFVQQPDRFHPERGALWNYLYMDAYGDLRNAWQKERRRREREIAFDPVAHDWPDGNSDVEAAIIRKLAPDGLPEGAEASVLMARLRADIPDDRDWQVVTLMAQGERATSVYAAILGITERPAEQQRRLVKQAKDRLRLKLKRRGVKFDGE